MAYMSRIGFTSEEDTTSDAEKLADSNHESRNSVHIQLETPLQMRLI